MCSEKRRIGTDTLDYCCLLTEKFRQESLGYSPFELLYGRTVRGPMSILRELMTNENC